MKRIYLLLCLALLRYTSPDYISSEELGKYISEEKDQLTRNVHVNNHLIQVTYRPDDLWIYQEAGGLTIDSATYNSLGRRYSDQYYFTLSPSLENVEALNPAKKGLDQYGELMYTSSFRMDDHVRLITSGQDTIRVSGFVLNGTFGFSNSTDLPFAFDKNKDKETVSFNLNEFGLGIGNSSSFSKRRT